MRKLFRFKYEPCNGTCYAWCDVLPETLNKLSEDARKATVEKMVEAHNRLCDNPDFSFGVDLDERLNLFVAHFRGPNETETFVGQNLAEAVVAVHAKVLRTEIPKVSGACTFGDNGAENLGQEILRACTDEVFRKAHHDACPCQHS